MTSTHGQTLVVSSVAELRRLIDAFRRRQVSIGLVPTMGALHEGHLSLVRASREECGMTVVSIFVNPTQFGPHEDLQQYPRTLEADLEALARCGVELAFVPSDEEVYCPAHATTVHTAGVAEPLEGECRPGHFSGVATIVLKLLNMVRPDVAFFGQKDYQQVSVVRQMVRDLNVPVAIRVCPTVREEDGLAMSSRNRYLSPGARERALVLWRSLRLAAEMVGQGERQAATIVRRMREVIASAGDAQIEYVAVVDADTLQPVTTLQSTTLAALAVRIEGTRLIDNCLLRLP